MAPRDKRRNRTLWGAIIADPYRKLAAIGLAVALWFFLDQQVTGDHELELTLEPVNQALPNWQFDADLRDHLFVRMPLAQVTNLGFVNGNTGASIKQVTVKVHGPSRVINEIREHRPSMVAGPFEDLKWDSIDSFPFDVGDLAFVDRTITGIGMTMDPGRVSVLIEKNVDREVILIPELVDIRFRPEYEVLRQKLRENRYSFSREQAFVTGPPSKLEDFLKEAKPFTVELSPTSGQGQVRKVSGFLALKTEDLDLTLRDPPTLTYDLRLDDKQFDIEIPILVDDKSLPDDLQGKYQPREPSKTVKVSASGDLLTQLLDFEGKTPDERRAWARRYMRLVVVIPPLAEGDAARPQYDEQARLVLRDDLAGEDPVNYGLARTETVTLIKVENR